MTTATPVNFSAWLKQGAVYGFKDQLQLFWGDAAQSKTPVGYPAIYTNDFFLSALAPWFQYSETAEVAAAPLEIKTPEPLSWQEPDYKHFARHFAKSMEAFHNEGLQKIVLATETRAPKLFAPDVFLKNVLRDVPANTHLYGQWNEREGFIGFTPEVLFKINGAELQTMALAGTAASNDAARELHSTKNKEEHQWVIEDIRQVLAPLGTVHVGTTEILSLATLSHLYTPIRSVLAQAPDVNAALHALHPTPALGAMPRTQVPRLQEWRAGYGTFGAPFVVATAADRATALVGIRQLAWDEDYYYIRCGCGVVKESRLEEEWQELLLKIQSVKQRFGWKNL